MSDNLSSVVIGAESLCTLCSWGKIVQTKMIPSPHSVAEWKIEHPEGDPSSIFFIYIEYDSYCTNPCFAGGRIGRPRNPSRMGTVLNCEGFQSRDS